MYKISERLPKIFLLQFDDNYEMAMSFLRYQEFYESPNPKFRNKAFQILDFMDWYRSDRKRKTFTYPTDWSGFNIPATVIPAVQKLGIKDPNKYDTLMTKAWEICNKKAKGDKFYMIGAGKVEADQIINHELAHGLFFTNQNYQKKAKSLVKNISKLMRNKIDKTLTNMGYTKKVLVDEAQAYLATGCEGIFNDVSLKKQQPFQELFKEFTTDL